MQATGEAHAWGEAAGHVAVFECSDRSACMGGNAGLDGLIMSLR